MYIYISEHVHAYYADHHSPDGLIIITKRISRGPIYHTRWQHRVLYNNTNHTHTHARTHARTHTHTQPCDCISNSSHPDPTEEGKKERKKSIYIYIYIYLNMLNIKKTAGYLGIDTCNRSEIVAEEDEAGENS